MLKHPCYVVLEIPNPVAAQVLALRRRYDARLADFPAEITITGSSGLGPLVAGQSETRVFNRLQALAETALPLVSRFIKIRRFASGPVIWLQPADAAPFMALHQALADSNLVFHPHRFAYTPHCSLCTAELPPAQQEQLLSEDIPASTFTLGQLALYQVAEGRSRLLQRFGQALS